MISHPLDLSRPTRHGDWRRERGMKVLTNAQAHRPQTLAVLYSGYSWHASCWNGNCYLLRVAVGSHRNRVPLSHYCGTAIPYRGFCIVCCRFNHRGPVPKFLLCPAALLVPSERFLGPLGTDLIPDHRVGDYSAHDESAPGDARIRASSR